MEEAVRLRNVYDRILRDFHGILSKAIPLRQQPIRLGWKTHRECWRDVAGQFLKATRKCRLAAAAMTKDQDDGGMTNKSSEGEIRSFLCNEVPGINWASCLAGPPTGRGGPAQGFI
jgi:hypothetical protein